MRLYLDGTLAGSTNVPNLTASAARDFALGGNPHFPGDEFLAARFSQLRFYGRALAPPEIADLSAHPGR
jgi:hypothetical protein